MVLENVGIAMNFSWKTQNVPGLKYIYWTFFVGFWLKKKLSLKSPERGLHFKYLEHEKSEGE